MEIVNEISITQSLMRQSWNVWSVCPETSDVQTARHTPHYEESCLINAGIF